LLSFPPLIHVTGEYERVQKKAFTNWINSHLLKVGQKVNDLYEDLRDGSRLLMLIELLTGEKLRREKGKMRVHKLQNIQNVLDYLTTKNKMKLVNIHSESLVEGKPTPTLGLVWSLILRFQISGAMQPSESGSRAMSPVEVSAAELKKKLLQWAQAATEGYEEVEVRNFTTSWKDGLAFCAIIDRHRPELLNYDDCDPDTPLSNLELAMSVAEKELGIVRIIDPEDIHVEKPDDKAVMTYVSFLHNAFPDMPPSRRKRGPEVSVEDYGELFAATRKWVESKRNEVAKRNFPNSVAEMKVNAEGFQTYKTKELPLHQRDMATLKDMYTRLVEQAAKKKRGAPVPAEMTFEPLEEEWAELQRENEECENAMKAHLDKLQKLEDLAQSILTSCATASVTLDTLESEVEEFETSCTSLPPQTVQENAVAIRDKLQNLEKPLAEMGSGVEELEDGNYHNLETVDNSVERVKSKHASLLSRLEVASSVATEAQEVVKVEDSIQELEVWLVSCGKFAANQNILGQIEEHRAFEREQLSAAKGRVTRITSSPPPPGLEGRVSQMTSRWQQILRQTDERLTGLEPLEEIAREFDRVKNPLEDWLLTKTETFASLPLVEVAAGELERERREMGELAKEVEERKREVDRLEELATKFEMETEPVQSLADRYARRLKKQGSIPDNIDATREERDPSAEPEASFVLQADALQVGQSLFHSTLEPGMET
ncbi:Dystonin, partial [Geodia barretti]